MVKVVKPQFCWFNKSSNTLHLILIYVCVLFAYYLLRLHTAPCITSSWFCVVCFSMPFDFLVFFNTKTQAYRRCLTWVLYHFCVEYSDSILLAERFFAENSQNYYYIRALNIHNISTAMTAISSTKLQMGEMNEMLFEIEMKCIPLGKSSSAAATWHAIQNEEMPGSNEINND